MHQCVKKNTIISGDRYTRVFSEGTKASTKVGHSKWDQRMFQEVKSHVKTVANGHLVNQIEQSVAKSMQAKLLDQLASLQCSSHTGLLK